MTWATVLAFLLGMIAGPFLLIVLLGIFYVGSPEGQFQARLEDRNRRETKR